MLVGAERAVVDTHSWAPVLPWFPKGCRNLPALAWGLGVMWDPGNLPLGLDTLGRASQENDRLKNVHVNVCCGGQEM